MLFATCFFVHVILDYIVIVKVKVEKDYLITLIYLNWLEQDEIWIEIFDFNHKLIIL